MRLAYLILAHHAPEQLGRLVRRLSGPGTDIYIHIDCRASIEAFLPLQHLPGVCFVDRREKVYWGAFSIVQATMNGFQQISRSGVDYVYITLLSGQDYPLVSNQAITAFFANHPGKAFMEFYSIRADWQEALPRLQKYHLTNYPFAGSARVEQLVNKVLPKRKMPDLEFVGRSQWFSIALDQMNYILDIMHSSPALRNYFRFTWGSDEFVFQTLLYNSRFRETMVNNNLRYTDWLPDSASPRILGIADAIKLKACEKLFARKFDMTVESTILDLLDRT